MSTTKQTTTVFVGGISKLNDLTNSAVYTELLAANVGLYGHMNGIFDAVVGGYMQSLANDMASDKSAPGVAELGFGGGYAQGKITIKNTSSSDLILQVGDTYTASNGEKYVLLSFAGQPGYETGETGANKNGYVSTSSGGYYDISAGSESTLLWEAVGDTTSYNATANSLTSLTGTNSAAISVVSNTAFTGGGDDPNFVLEYRSGYSSDYASTRFYNLYQRYGYDPTEANVNVAGTWTQNDLTAWKTYIQDARAIGVMNLAPIFTENGLDADFSQNFATSDYWKIYREAALYAGGLSFDTPAGFFNTFTENWFTANSVAANTYVTFVETQIKWANSEGLRSSVIIGPYENGGGAYEPNYLADVKTMLEKLKADGALPSQIIIENYVGDSTNSFDTNTSDTESLNAVATWVAENFSGVVTNSEQDLETVGGSGVDLIMTGIKPTVSVTAGTALIYDAPSLFASSTSDVVSVTLTLSSETGLSLVDTKGTISSDGKSLTYSGTPAEVTALLEALKIKDEASVAGTATLSLNFVSGDSSDSITGTTTIDYAKAQTVSGTVTPSATALNYGATTDLLSSATVSDTVDTNDLTLKVSLGSAKGALALTDSDSAAMISSDGQTLTATGSASTLTSILKALGISDAASKGGSTTLDVSVTDENGVATSLLDTTLSYVSSSGEASVTTDTTNVSTNGHSILTVTGVASLNGATVTGSGTILDEASGTLVAGTNGQSYVLEGTSQLLQANGKSLSVDASGSLDAGIALGGSSGTVDTVTTGAEASIWTGNSTVTIKSNPQGENDPGILVDQTSKTATILAQDGTNATFNAGNQSMKIWIDDGANVTFNGSAATSTDVIAIDHNDKSGTTNVYGGAEKLFVVEWNEADHNTDPSATVNIHAGSGLQTLFIGGNYDITNVYGDGTAAGMQEVVLSDNTGQETNVYGGLSAQQVWAEGQLNAYAGSDSSDAEMQVIIQAGATNFTANAQKTDIEQWAGSLTADMSKGSASSYLDITLDAITSDVISGLSSMSTATGSYSFNINSSNDIGSAKLTYSGDDATIALGHSSITLKGVGHTVSILDNSNSIATVTVDTKTTAMT